LVFYTCAGQITEADLDFAEKCKPNKAAIFGFNVGATSAVVNAAKKRGIKLHTQNVIYNLMDNVRVSTNQRLLCGRPVAVVQDELSMLMPTHKQMTVTGSAEVAEVRCSRELHCDLNTTASVPQVFPLVTKSKTPRVVAGCKVRK
jgi:hypothetical protein